MLFFPLVNGVLPLRLLVKALDILKHTLVAHSPAKYPSGVEQLWHTLLLGCEKFPDFKVILEHAYDYADLYAEDYRVQLVKTRTILKYITTSGELAQDYRLCWSNACEDTRDLFIASLLLRFSTLTMLKSACFTYELAYSHFQIVGEDKPQLIKLGPFSGNVHIAQSIPSLRKFESILPRNDGMTEEDAALVKSLLDMALHEIKTRGSDEGYNIQSSKRITTLPASSSRCNSSVQAFWNSCVQKAAIVYQHNAIDLVQKAASFYCTDYASTFESFQTHLSAEQRAVNQYHGMYRFSVDMLQSRIPNTVAILLNDGVVAFRALKTIKKGQTLTYDPDIRDTSDDYTIVDKFNRTTDTLRCLECRFKIGSLVGKCLCQAVKSVRTKEMNILIDYLKSLENIIANSKEESPADRVTLINLRFFSKLWKSIFLSEFNKYSFMNFQLQLRIWALRGARGFADIQSISKSLAVTLSIIETSFGSKYELCYGYTVRT
uniref:Uncharacterized protein n=1 Tax=Anopheles atroparvus TaxID=41427 RepID=A0AAG5DKJ2_ANOAO